MQTEPKYRAGYAKRNFDYGYGKIEKTVQPALFKRGRSGNWLFWGYHDTKESAEASAARWNNRTS